MQNSLIAALLFLALARPLWAAPALDTAALDPCGDAVAEAALDGARFRATDGRIIRLALVKAPELWGADGTYRNWPYATEARDALMARLKGQALTLFCEGPKTDRQGDIVAHVMLPDGVWLQGDLAEAGTVFVFPRPTRRTGLADLYAAEAVARAARRGLWAFDNLQPVDATGKGVRTGWFQLVEGTVVKAERVGVTVFLNFGDDWRSDFTAEIPVNTLRYYEKAGLDPLSLAGRRIEVRGWIDFKAGPRLLLQGPGQIRILDDTADKEKAPAS
ncbi:MAG: thermonuclease family protein [Alphaproteobacteria bacterium]|nr:MAG: thermonuclease family protein [Alphaproteobacteria bacterium]